MAAPLKDQRMDIGQNPMDKREVRLFTDGYPMLASVPAVHDEEVGRRLVACWNACLGIETEKLEEGPRGGPLDR